MVCVYNTLMQVVDGLREELSQARVSNNQLLEALEVQSSSYFSSSSLSSSWKANVVGERTEGEGV